MHFKVSEIACFIFNALCSLAIITGFGWILMRHRNRDRVGGTSLRNPEMIRLVPLALIGFLILLAHKTP